MDIEKVKDMANRRHDLLRKMLPHARAAANQMKDAGMHAGAAPLLQIIFEIDAIDQEGESFIKKDPIAALEVLARMMEERFGEK